MKTLCIILARAGSKGLPGKNRRVLAGKPLVAWSIQHARTSSRINKVVVSTDDSEIAKIAHKCSVDVIGRPEELATDTASVEGAARHALITSEEQHRDHYDAAVVLYGNVPVRPPGLIDQAIQKLETSGADSVQSVCPVGKFHPYWMSVLGGDTGDVMTPYQPNEIDRRQDLPPVYQIDGGVIVVRRDQWLNAPPSGPHAFLGQHRCAVVTEPGQVVDIDHASDFLVAQVALEQVHKKGGAP